MVGELPLDDALAPFTEEVRFAVSGPPPVPSPALAAVLAVGLSPPAVLPTEKGDLLVTAASNVHGPAPQAAGLPNWKKEKEDMPVTGILTGLLAKISGVGTAAKAAVAGATAVATMGLAGGAAGLLPGPAQNLVAGAVNATTPFEFPDPASGPGVVEHAVPAVAPVNIPVPAVPPVNVAAQPPVSATASASASASPAAKATAPAVTPAVPNVGVPPIPAVSVPPALAGLVGKLPACVTSLIPAGGGTPDPAKLAAQIQVCIPQILSTANLPPDVAKCVSAVLGTIGGANGMNTSSVPGVGNLTVSSCVPMDVSKCVSNMMSLLANLRGLGGGIPGMGSIPGLNSVTGCVPMNVSTCITSITAAVAAGTTPKLDLSACMPTTGTSTVPGFGSLPGLGGALSFFGR